MDLNCAESFKTQVVWPLLNISTGYNATLNSYAQSLYTHICHSELTTPSFSQFYLVCILFLEVISIIVFWLRIPTHKFVRKEIPKSDFCKHNVERIFLLFLLVAATTLWALMETHNMYFSDMGVFCFLPRNGYALYRSIALLGAFQSMIFLLPTTAYWFLCKIGSAKMLEELLLDVKNKEKKREAIELLHSGRGRLATAVHNL